MTPQNSHDPRRALTLHEYNHWRAVLARTLQAQLTALRLSIHPEVLRRTVERLLAREAYISEEGQDAATL